MKIQNLFSTGKMNKDVDERLIPNGEYIDAYNMRVLNTTGSDAGALENEKGNLKLTNVDVSNNPICIGSVADNSEEKIYWFVVNDLGYSYIYEYDAINKVTSTILADERTGDDQVLGFSKKNKITGVNVFYNISKGERLLVFTDNLNHPRCVNINRAKSFGLSNFDEEDINLYKKPPFEAPKVTPTNSLSAQENSVKERFFAFAYRYKYLDGDFSALSSFTNYQFVPGVFDLDFNTVENTGMINIFNSYLIKYNTGDKRVTDVQICFKTSNDSNVYIAETINKKESNIPNNANKTFTFTNKKIYKQLPADEITRVFDNVPLRALAQDVIEDRLVFGNYTIQYDLKENEDDDQFLVVSYHSNLVSKDQTGSDLTLTYNNNSDELTIDLTDISLKKDFTLFLSVGLKSDEAGTAPNQYYGGSFNGANGIVLSKNYATVSDFANSSDFSNALSALTNNFKAGVETTPPQNTAETTYGSFQLVSSTSTSITISAPTITHVVDNTPGDDDITDGDTTDFVEQFEFDQTETLSRFTDKISNSSLKTLKNYEVGLCYLDKHGRYTSIIPSKLEEGFTNEVFVPIEDSVNLNSIQTTINSKPPYWADRYKFFIKDSRSNHYNIFATLFYEEGVYRWVKLEGSNLGKVEEGDFLIVKSDDNGPLANEVKVKVIELKTKVAADEKDDVDGNNEGWITTNEDSSGNEIVEELGTFMKIKPIGFTMDYNPYNFANYEGNDKIQGPFGTGSFWGDEGKPSVTLPSEANRGLAMADSNGDNYFEYQVIGPGSKIRFDFRSWQRFDSDGDDTRSFYKEYVVTGSYETDSDSSAFEKWLEAETNWYIPEDIPVGEDTYWRDPDDQFHLKFIETGVYAETNSTFRTTINIESTKFCKRADTCWMEASINLQLVSGILIFETEARDLDTDIYYETEQTFKIENGFHKGNTQDQTSSQPAICDLNYFNCFSFGNGCESVNVRDDRFTYRLGGDYRPNIALEQGYKEINVEHGLIFSGSFNENTGFNAINEFNSSRGITKNLDRKFGSIQKLFSRERDLIVFQEDRVSKVLYGKTILTSPDGTGSLSQIESVLGQDVPYSGEYGISLNPESFASFEGRIYFADANRGAILRLGGDGITPISYQGMRTFFKQNLYENRDKFLIGGFDPKYHQYIISIGTEDLPTETPEFDCASELSKSISSDFEYKLNVGQYPGTATINYSTSSSIDITIVYNGTTHNNNGLTGSGSVTFNVDDSDLLATSLASVTISPESSANIVLTHACPVPTTMEVVLVVVNDSTEAGDTIINRYKHDGDNGNVYNSDLDVFDFDELARYESVSGIQGESFIPSDGDIVTMSSLKQIGVHTADFNPCNRMGYLVSDSTTLTVQNILDQATYPASTKSEDSTQEENVATFTFNRSNTDEKLYLVWNYIDVLPVLTDDTVSEVPNGGSKTISVLSNDTVTSPYTVTIGTQPSYGTAVVNPNNSITYTHDGSTNLNDSFTYIVDRGGTCSAEATVTTEALEAGVVPAVPAHFVRSEVSIEDGDGYAIWFTDNYTSLDSNLSENLRSTENQIDYLVGFEAPTSGNNTISNDVCETEQIGTFTNVKAAGNLTSGTFYLIVKTENTYDPSAGSWVQARYDIQYRESSSDAWYTANDISGSSTSDGGATYEYDSDSNGLVSDGISDFPSNDGGEGIAVKKQSGNSNANSNGAKVFAFNSVGEYRIIVGNIETDFGFFGPDGPDCATTDNPPQWTDATTTINIDDFFDPPTSVNPDGDEIYEYQVATSSDCSTTFTDSGTSYYAKEPFAKYVTQLYTDTAMTTKASFSAGTKRFRRLTHRNGATAYNPEFCKDGAYTASFDSTGLNSSGIAYPCTI